MPPRTENQQARKEKEASIFEAACRVFRHKGYHQARMADVATEAGISYGLVYHYFKSKADLFEALIAEWWNGLEILTTKLRAEPGPVTTKLEAIAEYFLGQYALRPDLVHVFVTEFSRSTANLTPERLDDFKKLMSRTEELITEAQCQGAIRRDLKARYLTYAFLGSIEALLSAMVLEDQPVRDQKHKNKLVTSIMTMFWEGARPVTNNGRQFRMNETR